MARQRPLRAFGRVLFWLCAAIGVLAGGGMLLIGDGEIKAMGLYILVGMVALGLVLRWIFRIFR